MSESNLPLSGIRVLDFSNLLPGPFATLMLAEAGASVVKVERPGVGDLGRARKERGESIDFGLLNRGKKSVALDLKSEADREVAKTLALQADILVEQFRPGVMARLGLGYEALSERNPRLIYCAISGYGQTGPLAQLAAHDLNYVARSGMLSLSIDSAGRPPLPQAQVADIGGGSYPALVNILMALYQRVTTGRGSYIDVAMAENTIPWMRRALTPVLAGGKALPPGTHSGTGGSARYDVYATADGQSLAVCAIEAPFWKRFCEILELSEQERDETRGPEPVRRVIAQRLAARTAAEWMRVFEGEDVCVERVRDLDEAVRDPHFQERGVFRRKLRLQRGDNQTIPALPLPLAPQFVSDAVQGYPELGGTDPTASDLWART